MLTPNRLLLSSLALLVLCGCPTDASKKMAQKQKELDEAKAEKAKKDEQAEQLAAPPKESVKLGPPWEDPSYKDLRPDGPCPEGIWALFPSQTPGDDKAAKKENEKKRGELAKGLREAQFLVKLRAPDEVKLLPYDAPKGTFSLDVLGTIDCTDSFGHVAIAWTKAKAGDPALSAAKQDADVTQSIWMAEPLTWSLPMSGVSEAKKFETKNKFGLSARVVVKFGKAEWDHKMKKVPKSGDKGITIGGGSEDWGAGRLVHAELVAVRVATDKEKSSLFEKKP